MAKSTAGTRKKIEAKRVAGPGKGSGVKKKNRLEKKTRLEKETALDKKARPERQAGVKKSASSGKKSGVGRALAAPESMTAKQARAANILAILRKEFPAAVTALRHDNPFQLLVATILSAQCTDERVNMVTPGLFEAYPGPAEFARADRSAIEEIIRSTGFFRNKAKSIQACSAALLERHGGRVPDRIEELVMLPGVGRKTANVVLGQAFGIASGVVVDTHVQRLAGRLGFSTQSTPEKIETDLMELFPPSDWIELSSVLILHGRKWCNARRPQCVGCPVRSLCPSADAFGG